MNQTVLFEMPPFSCGDPTCSDESHTARWAVRVVVASDGEEKFRDMCWKYREEAPVLREAHVSRVREIVMRESSLRPSPDRPELSRGWWGKPRPVVSNAEGKGKEK